MPSLWVILEILFVPLMCEQCIDCLIAGHPNEDQFPRTDGRKQIRQAIVHDNLEEHVWRRDKIEPTTAGQQMFLGLNGTSLGILAKIN